MAWPSTWWPRSPACPSSECGAGLHHAIAQLGEGWWGYGVRVWVEATTWGARPPLLQPPRQPRARWQPCCWCPRAACASVVKWEDKGGLLVVAACLVSAGPCLPGQGQMNGSSRLMPGHSFEPRALEANR